MEDLLDYSSYSETESCYLDGRYFNLVLAPIHTGIVTTPMYVDLREERTPTGSRQLTSISVEMPITTTDTRNVNIIRVIITRSRHLRHSALLILDTSEKRVVFWNPSSSHTEKDIDRVILSMIKKALNIEDYESRVDPLRVPTDSPSNCPISGYCNAYIIKRVIDNLMGRDFDPSNIKRFVAKLEHLYSHQLKGNPDIEYDTNFSPLGAGIGALGGAAVGGIIAGPAGLVVGGVGGGLLGGFIGGAHHHN
jgi:hypothetical protein